ncbi:MAG TPA: hypothetical protein VL326_27955 [Kofleriaceae bacterium]|nr:hypothetical protein [Kofleriaceae bacterium]
MRCLLILAMVSGCYAPRVLPGAPCDPDLPSCPRGQVCISNPDGAYCLPDGTIPIDAPFTAAADADVDAPSLIDAPPGAMPMQLTYPAAVAECINPAVPSTATCRSVNGDTQMVVDADDSGTNNPWIGFVRFDIDDKVANKTVTAVRFQIRTTNNSKATAPKSGEVWQVTSFTKDSLSMTVPTHVGSTPLGADKGAVSQNITLTWSMPVSLVAANSGVFFSIETSSSDGTNYWNTSGTTPPVLIVNVQ